MPMHHMHAIAVNLLATACAGGAVMCLSGFPGAESFFAHLAAPEPRITWYSAVPTIHLALLEYAVAEPTPPPHSLRFIRNCSAALLPEIASQLEKVLQTTVLATYAMSESVPICSNPLKGVRKRGSVGPASGPMVRIASHACVEGSHSWLSPGEEGEVCVSGPSVVRQYQAAAGVEVDPNAGAWVHDDDGEWLRTGDKGWIDEDGYLFLSGRFKELINRGGEKIAPNVVEQALVSHPGVGHIMAFAAPHRELGEVVGLMATRPPLVAPRLEPATVKTLRGHAFGSGALPAKWLPECLVWVDSLPKGATGKPARIGIASSLGLPEFHNGGGHQHGAWRAKQEKTETEGTGGWRLEWLLDVPLSNDGPMSAGWTETSQLIFSFRDEAKSEASRVEGGEPKSPQR
jgi:oxalate---CoA ligase